MRLFLPVTEATTISAPKGSEGLEGLNSPQSPPNTCPYSLPPQATTFQLLKSWTSDLTSLVLLALTQNLLHYAFLLSSATSLLLPIASPSYPQLFVSVDLYLPPSIFSLLPSFTHTLSSYSLVFSRFWPERSVSFP